MAKLRTLLLIMACMAIPWTGADAAESAPCTQGLPPMSEALHAVVHQAEKRAGDGDAEGAAEVLTGWLDAHLGETHPYPYYDAGFFLHQAGKRDAAVDCLQKAVRLAPCFHEAWQLLAALYQEAGEMAEAAEALEKAAAVTQDPETWHQTAVLWLDADHPKKALVLLEKLAQRKDPRVEWLVALANAYMILDQIRSAAVTMDRVIQMDPKSEYLYNGGVLWLHAGQPEKALGHLLVLCKRSPAKAEWFVALALALVDANREKDALAVMNRTTLTDPKAPATVRYQGALVWLRLQRPGHALPVLKVLCASGTPAFDWLATLIKTHVELDQMPKAETVIKRLIDLYPENMAAWRLAVWVALQQSEYAKAAAAMAVAVRLGPPDPGQMKELADLYHMAGVPVKAAAVLRKTWIGDPTAEDWDRLTSIYLSGHRYDMALACARSAARTQATPDRWQTVGAVAFRLRRFEESHDAYCRSAELSPDADIRLKAGYAALKLERLEEAGRLFKEALHRAGKNSRTAYEAHRNLSFIKKMMAIHEPS